MKKGTKWAIAGGIVLLAAAFVALLFLFILPYHNAASRMPDGAVLKLEQTGQDSYLLSWPAADAADYYSVEIFRAGEEDPFWAEFAKDGESCVLSGLPKGENLEICVNSVVCYSESNPDRIRLGDEPTRVSLLLAPPQIRNLTWSADDGADTVTVSYVKEADDLCRVYLQCDDGSWQQVKSVRESELSLSFGEDREIAIPAYGETVKIAFDAYRASENLEFTGLMGNEITVIREDLLGREIAVQVEDQGKNVAKLTWNESKGERYAVQLRLEGSDTWTTLGEIPADGERSFTTHHLPVTSSPALRVVALGGQTMQDSEFAAISEETVFETVESPIYATVWPTGKLKTYSDPERTQEVGQVKPAVAYCVLDEIGDSFAICVDGQTVYIESTHCLINLPEYIGDLCSYKITNSYASLYMVHEYEIPRVTNVVTGGYERVKMKNGEYLVPLLYPTAKKLAVAAKSALEQGVRLKIYDAYRPNKATVEIYNRTEEILENELPKKTFRGGVMYDLPKLPAKENPEDPDPVMTYRVVMTNNDAWRLGSFLAQGASLHNYGIAVDLTLETLEGEELNMQTSMHDLSFYSSLSRNNANAKLLASIMTGAGLGELVSEWWHFQDNELRNQVKLTCVWAGVTPECWMKDDFGWKYRRYTGEYFADGAYDIYGTVYTFDAQGYLVTE